MPMLMMSNACFRVTYVPGSGLYTPYSGVYIYFKDVSCEFDEFRVVIHLCTLRCWYLYYTMWVVCYSCTAAFAVVPVLSVPMPGCFSFRIAVCFYLVCWGVVFVFLLSTSTSSLDLFLRPFFFPGILTLVW